MKLFNHKLCRPPKDAVNVERWSQRKGWVPDDGKPAYAFSGLVNGTPYAWATRCSDNCYFSCIQTAAMERTTNRFHCANGHDVQSVISPSSTNPRRASRRR